MLKLEKQYGLYTIKEQLTVGDDRACCCAADPFLGHDVLLQLIKLPEQWDSEQLESFEKRLFRIKFSYYFTIAFHDTKT